jgi:uroporphyrinogen decarboxylase
MTQSKKELIKAVFTNRPVDRVPVGFWFHFLPQPETADALADPSEAEANVAGHQSFYEKFQPDFVKIMTDGYFGYPHPAFKTIRTAADFGRLQPLGSDHPWIREQVKHVRRLQAIFGAEVLSFYNIFAPARVLEWSLPAYTPALLGDWIESDKEAVKRGLAVLAEDIAALAQAVIRDGGATGIYFSVQNIADKRVTEAVYADVFKPGELTVQQAANEASPYNILHICGYEGHHNDLSWYADYPAQAVNWAVKVEGIPLGQGRQIFGGKAVIGGFGNTQEDILYTGNEAAIKAETRAILQEAGHTGVILGADCTVPGDIDLRHLAWVREAAQQ